MKAHCRNFVWLTVVIYTYTYILCYVYIIINCDSNRTIDTCLMMDSRLINSGFTHLYLFRAFSVCSVWKKVHLKDTKSIRNAIFENNCQKLRAIVRNWISSGLLRSSSKIWWRGWCKEHFLSNKRMSDFSSFLFNYKTNYLLLGAKYSHFQTSTTWKQNKIEYISIRQKMFFDQPLSSPD